MISPRQTTMRMHLWLENGQGVLCGQGRIQLLEYVAFTGSLSAAAKALGMAYRAAWGKIKATEEALGISLLHKEERRNAGTSLSPEGVRLIAAYRAWQKEVEAFALQSAAEHFGQQPEQYHSVKDLPSPPSDSTTFLLENHSE